MVAHFQRLFDVPTEGGVYTRMSELYVRVGEMQNILHSLKDILGLGVFKCKTRCSKPLINSF